MSQAPVAGAKVFISGTETYELSTDSSGYFKILVMPGKYNIIIQHEEYRSEVRENIRVETGKETILTFDLSEFAVDLSSVTVTPEKRREYELTLFKIQQYAAVFYDPARVVTSHAGAVNSDDQANHLTVRGTSPNYIQWRLEGVEIVSPNHLENSGTLNDRPALNGGGVSMISAQLIETSGFKFAPFTAQSGNVLSGMFDLRLRNGNEKKMERTMQASFLGTDICLEGPFSKKSKASYLVNFRYSTIGLLSKLGINFGDEQSNYKDLSFVLALPVRRNTIRLFGMVGNSETVYKGKRDSSIVEVKKELYDIDYRSFTALSGTSLTMPLSNTLFLKTVLVYSSKDTRRSAVPLFALRNDTPSEVEKYYQEKWSASVFASKRIENHTRIKVGSGLSSYYTRILSARDDIGLINGNLTEWLVQPFISGETSLLKKFEIHFGLHGFVLPRIEMAIVQPRAAIKFRSSSNHEFQLSYGEDAQLQPVQLSLSTVQNRNLKPTTSKSVAFSHQASVRSNTFKTELYYQLFEHVPVNLNNGFSAFNFFNEMIYFDLESLGKARVYGVDFLYEKLYKGFYIIPSLSVYDCSYSLNSREFYTGRFNTNYNAVLTCGKEFRLKDKKRFISADARMISRNGYLEPKPKAASPSYVFSERLPPYFRVDLRLSYRKNRDRSTVIWALDIQNAGNTKNVSYHFYDSFTRKFETRYQLGLIPVLSYKILF